MEKVYLLLRNNCEAGPYTYEELLQQDLLPTDLIWIEGKSMFWMRPSEMMKELSPSLPHSEGEDQGTNTTKCPSPAIPWYQKSRSPEAELEAKAIALREQAELATATQKRYQHQPRTFKRVKHNPVIYQEEETALLLEIHRVNKKSVTLPQLIAAGVITALVATGWYNRDKLTFVRPQASIISQAATPVVFQVIPPSPVKTVSMQSVDTTIASTMPLASAEAPVITVTASAQKPLALKSKAKTVSTPVPQQTDATAGVSEKKEEKPIVTDPPIVEKKEVVEIKTEPDTTAEALTSGSAKKKGLGETLKKIFKKKRKAGDTPQE